MKEPWPAVARALASGASQEDAAGAGKITARTLRRWLNDEPTFADAVEEYRAAMLAEASGVLASHTAAAAKRLTEIATASEIPVQVQLSAARAVLDMASRYRADESVEQRIRALEMAAGLRSEVSW